MCIIAQTHTHAHAHTAAQVACGPSKGFAALRRTAYASVVALRHGVEARVEVEAGAGAKVGALAWQAGRQRVDRRQAPCVSLHRPTGECGAPHSPARPLQRCRRRRRITERFSHAAEWPPELLLLLLLRGADAMTRFAAAAAAAAATTVVAVATTDTAAIVNSATLQRHRRRRRPQRS